MVVILVVNKHHRVNASHVINLILGDVVDMHLVEYANQSAVRSLRS
jgi:hypothetical protein